MAASNFERATLDDLLAGRTSVAEAVGFGPDALARIVSLGVSCYAASDFGRAERLFAALVRIEPRLPHGHAYRGLVAERMGRRRDAAAAYDRALDLFGARTTPEPAGVIELEIRRRRADLDQQRADRLEGEGR